ncbi:MAG: type II toxin-antitoxin system VapB family antitoxin [Deltaproteobacteria bacterium]|nr:type II toxin-antitoxin system VapB family antitoxin [Deltaproteobacteria bacterium]
MKTTIEIDDRLFERAKREAARQGITLRALVNGALQASLAPRARGIEPFELQFPVVHDDEPPAVDLTDRRSLHDLVDER